MANTQIIPWPKSYKIRPDESVKIPGEIMQMVEWLAGDDVVYEVNMTAKTVTIIKAETGGRQ